MYEAILTPRATPVCTVEELASFGRFDPPQASPVTEDYTNAQLFIEAAADRVESLAATAMITEEVLLTFDYFPGQQDPRAVLDYQLSYAYDQTPWWWFGFAAKDSIELVRRPLVTSLSPVIAPIVKYRDEQGVLQTFDAANYYVEFDKITLLPGSNWPLTDRRKDCVQITYTAGYGDASSQVPPRLKLATLYLANHYYAIRDMVSVDATMEVTQTLCSLLSAYRSFRIAR